MIDLLNVWTSAPYLLMACLIAIAAFLQGIGGVGFAMFAAPVAALYFPELVPGPLLTLGGFVTLLTALRERQAVVWRSVGSALAGRAGGTVLAVFALTQLSQKPLNLLFAGLILAAVVLSVAGLRIAASRRNVVVAGLASGVMGTLTSVGAPPLAIALQYTPPANLRATLGTILCCGSTFSLLMLAATGHYGMRHLLLSAALLPFMLLGFTLSNRIRHRISPSAVRRILLLFCTISALGLVSKTI